MGKTQRKLEQEPDEVKVFDSAEPNDKGKVFPAKPSTWDSFKENFESNATRINLDAVRKRREQSGK